MQLQGLREVLQLSRLGPCQRDHLSRKVRKLGNVDAKGLIAGARADLVQHGQLACGLVNGRLHMQVGHPNWPLQGRSVMHDGCHDGCQKTVQGSRKVAHF